MYDILVVVFVHLIVTVVRLLKPGGLRAVVAESVLTASNPPPESPSEASFQPARFRPDYRRFMHPADVSISYAALRYCAKAIDAAAFSSRTDQTKVPQSVFVQARRSAGAEGAGPGIDRCRRGNETT